METTKPTKKHARKIIELLSYGLIDGLGTPEPGKMCVEAAVCYALGEKHGESPTCVGKAVRNTKISLNDAGWSSKQARAKGLRRIAVAQLGSNTIDQKKFLALVQEKVIRRILPIAIRKHITSWSLSPKIKAEFKKAAIRCKNDGNVESAAHVLSLCSEFTNIWYAANYAIDADEAIDAVQTLGDKWYREAAKIIEEALVELKSPGVKWLDLCDEES
jgi:hypothetical protein